MSGVTGAVIAGGISAVGAVAGGIITANASGKAADTAAAAQTQAAQLQTQLGRESIAAQQQYGQKAIDAYTAQYNQSRADLEPFRQAQLTALGQEQALTDPNNPYYQNQRTLMTQNIQQQLAAQGLLRSKNQTDLLSNLELGLEGQRVGTINSLAGLGAAQAQAGLSQQYGAGIASAYQGLGSGIGSSLQGIGIAGAQGLGNVGNIYAQNQLQQGQALAGGINAVGNAFQGTYGNILANNRYNQFYSLLNRGNSLSNLSSGGAGGSSGGSMSLY